jgi:hypothetical protein
MLIESKKILQFLTRKKIIVYKFLFVFEKEIKDYQTIQKKVLKFTI